MTTAPTVRSALSSRYADHGEDAAFIALASAAG
jgi:hypothetical protein